MNQDHVEIEDKFEVPEAAHLSGLAEIAGVLAVEECDQELLEATYFDTTDLRLASLGLTLRRRTGGQDEGWHLKVPIPHGRYEVHEPIGDSASPIPPRLLDLVAGLTAGRVVGPVARISTERRVTRLLGNSSVLAEVADDRVGAWVLLSIDEPAELSWREWELELDRGGRTLLKDASRLVVKQGAVPSRHPSKLARVLGDRIPPQLGHGDIPIRPKDPAGSLVRRRLVEQVTEVLRGDPQVRLDLPDAVHRMRVAVRRLRSALAVYRPLIDPEVTDPLREELRWLAAALGEPRDAEVLRTQVGALVDEEPPCLVDSDVVAFVDALLDRRHQDKHQHLLSELRSKRYAALLDALSALATDPPLLEMALEPTRKVVPHLVRRDWHRLERRVAAARAASDTEDKSARLHDVRRAAKRVRYGLEPLVPVYGHEASRLVGATVDLQTLLGDHHDAVVVQMHLRELSHRAGEAGINAFTLGVLLAREQARALRFSDDFDRVWARAARPKLRRWLE